MELDNRIEKFNSVADKWNEHITKRMQENLKNAISHKNKDNLELIEIGDMGAIDSIEDGIVRAEILDGSMIEISQNEFKYNIEEGDVINLKLTYKDGKITKIDVLDKNNDEKLFRIRIIEEKMRQIRNK